jgi:hypothetical protein
LCLRYAPAKCGKFDVSQYFFQLCYCYDISKFDTFSSYHIVRTQIAKVTNFFPFCTIGISTYQKHILPYFIIPSTFSPQASSPLERYGQTEGQRKFFTPCYLDEFFFSTERAGPYPQAQLSTGLAELWGGWPIEQGQKESATYLRWNSTYDGDLQYIRLINLKRHIDYFSKGPKSSRTDRARKRRSFRVNSILSFCHNDKHETQHVGQLISIKGHTI